jgi:hypothetical protein
VVVEGGCRSLFIQEREESEERLRDNNWEDDLEKRSRETQREDFSFRMTNELEEKLNVCLCQWKYGFPFNWSDQWTLFLFNRLNCKKDHEDQREDHPIQQKRSIHFKERLSEFINLLGTESLFNWNAAVIKS